MWNSVCRLEEIQSPSKKLPPESTPRVVFTGLEPLQVQQYTKVRLHPAERLLSLPAGSHAVALYTPRLQRLYALGGEVAECSQSATHLVASKVTRTIKFLTAMSVVKHTVTPEWLDESWRSQKFVGTSLSSSCSAVCVCVCADLTVWFCCVLQMSRVTLSGMQRQRCCSTSVWRSL